MDTAKEVTQSLRAFFAKKGMTLTQVSEELGLSLGAVTNQLTGRKYFGTNVAGKWVAVFGFSFDYLTRGEGTLLEGEESQEEKEEESDGVFIPAKTIELYTSLAKTCETLSAIVQTYREEEQKKESQHRSVGYNRFG